MLHEIAEIVGPEQAIKLGQSMGGARVYFPAKAAKDHPLTLVLGIDDAQKLCDHYTGDTMHLPSKTQFKQIRNDLIRNEYYKLNGVKGFCRADFLAIKYGLSRRNILYIINLPSTANTTAA